jgi:uncharacterized RDD family membrane protein YckC
MKQGIICNLTNQPADFEETCSSFLEDSELKLKLESTKIENEILSKTASQSKRFANYIIDLVFYIIFSSIFGAILGIVLAIISPSSLAIFEQDNKLINYVLDIIAGMIYFSVLEATTGRTIAKLITKTKVVNEKGEKPNFGTIILRSLCRFIPFEPLSFLGSDNSGWHDKLSKTRVIEI